MPAALHGIITHYVETQWRFRLVEPARQLRLKEDLGLDSLTMAEIVLSVEDLLQITLSEEQWSHLQTLGEFLEYVERAARERPARVA
ncbi:MAG: acyl carrier protein [Opitutaceae bacterium]